MSDLTPERHLFLVNGEQDEGYSQFWRTVHIPESPAPAAGRLESTSAVFEPVTAKPLSSDS
jgi:hypothetical protein